MNRTAMKRAILPVLFLLGVFLVGWTVLCDNFLGVELTEATPTNGQMWAFNSATGKYALTAGPGSTPDASVSTKGLTKLSINPASATNPIAVGFNDPTVNPTPTAANAGNIPVVPAGGGAYAHINPPAGTDTALFSTGDALAPAFRAIVAGDIDELLDLDQLANVATMTEAVGDLLYVDSIGPVVWQRLAVGSNGQVLTLAGGKPSWAAASGVPDASVSVKGVSTLSINPASPTAPIAVGFNDPTVNPTPTSANAGNIPVVPAGGGAYQHINPPAGTDTALFSTGDAAAPAFRVVVAGDIDELLTLTQLVDVTITSVARGDIITRNGSSLWVNLAIGASGTVLHGGTDPSYSQVATGDIAGQAVTLAKIQNATANSRVIASGASGSGTSYVEATLASTLSFASNVLGVAADSIGATQLDSTTENGLVPAGTIVATARNSAPSSWQFCDGSAISRSTFATLFAAITKSGSGNTFDTTTDKVTFTAHGLFDNDPVQFYTTGTLPTGLTEGTVFFVRDKTANDFKVCSTPGGTAIDLTVTNGTGTQSWISAPYGDGNGETATTFNVPDLRGRVIAAPDAIQGGSAASRMTNAAISLKTSPGQTVGTQTHTLVTAEIPSHSHGYNDAMNGGAGNVLGGGTQGTLTTPQTGSTGGGGAHLNVQPTITAYYIIKE